MQKEKYILKEIFTPTNLKLIEFLITSDNTILSLSDLADKTNISCSSLFNNYNKLVDAGILIQNNRRTKNGWCKVLEIDYENELVDILIKTFMSMIRYYKSNEQQKNGSCQTC